ncbi:MAG TPA: hypothetical protein VN516_00335, partial [Candidatus Baltobacteraceae bacterium]|nr:hypothetical protein [Candidatus Baltobacteraceae bacterium]
QAIINGKSLNKISECTVSNGFVGIQSEGADFEIRKMYLEPLQQQEFFKTITDAQTGQYAVVNSDKTVVTLKEKDGKVIWSVDMIKSTKNDSWYVGPQIYSLRLWKNQLAVQFGKPEFYIDIQTGKITGSASD